MWTGMSMSVAFTRQARETCESALHTVNAEVAVEIVGGADGVQDLYVMARHVEVAEREVLRTMCVRRFVVSRTGRYVRQSSWMLGPVRRSLVAQEAHCPQVVEEYEQPPSSDRAPTARLFASNCNSKVNPFVELYYFITPRRWRVRTPTPRANPAERRRVCG